MEDGTNGRIGVTVIVITTRELEPGTEPEPVLILLLPAVERQF